MKKLFVLAFSLFSIFTILAFSGPSLIVDSRIHGPRIKNKDGTSQNWAGYAAIGNNANDVKGSWVVPKLICTGTNTYSSAWVGIDGYNNNSVEQTGTEQDCNGSTSSYYAWFEMYPKPGYIVPLTIQANDVMTADVNYLGNGNFQLVLTDLTTGQTFKTTQKMNKAQRQSAEWIMEAPWSGGILPLANFGTANFANSSATFGGKTGSISAFTNDQINMIASNGTVKATTSGLTNNGSNFSVTWNHN